MTSSDLQRFKLGFKYIEENVDVRRDLLQSYPRLKKTEPFSLKLNNFIDEMFSELWDKANFIFKDTDDFDPKDIEGTFKKHLDRFHKTREIHIWTGESSINIFGDIDTNLKFRAWHDYIHLTEGLGYDVISESIVGEIQKSQLPVSYAFEKELLHIEIIGQAQYHFMHGDFVDNQRDFTVQYLSNPIKALR